MSGGIEIDKTLFHDRLSSFLTKWKADKRSGDSIFGGANSICICVGKGDENNPDADTKTAAFQLWLLSYEFPQTLIVITPDVVHFVTTKKKAVYLEALKGGKIPIEIHKRGKDADENNAQFTKLADLIKSSGVSNSAFSLSTATKHV
jgi:nucleosome binding factor SPN SPT16 subunit